MSSFHASSIDHHLTPHSTPHPRAQAAERDYDLNRAAELKYGTLLELQKQLKEAEALLEAEAANSVGGRHAGV